jgi:hypothetical protein
MLTKGLEAAASLSLSLSEQEKTYLSLFRCAEKSGCG